MNLQVREGLEMGAFLALGPCRHAARPLERREILVGAILRDTVKKGLAGDVASRKFILGEGLEKFLGFLRLDGAEDIDAELIRIRFRKLLRGDI